MVSFRRCIHETSRVSIKPFTDHTNREHIDTVIQLLRYKLMADVPIELYHRQYQPNYRDPETSGSSQPSKTIGSRSKLSTR